MNRIWSFFVLAALLFGAVALVSVAFASSYWSPPYVLVQGSTELAYIGGEEVTVQDLNGDGRLDIVSTKAFLFGHYTVDVQLGAIDGGYVQGFEQNIGNWRSPRTLNVFDIDGDGFLDIVITAFQSQWLSVFFANGSGDFTLHEYQVPYPRGVILVDGAFWFQYGQSRLDQYTFVSREDGFESTGQKVSPGETMRVGMTLLDENNNFIIPTLYSTRVFGQNGDLLKVFPVGTAIHYSDGVLIVANSESIVAYDYESMQPLWQHSIPGVTLIRGLGMNASCNGSDVVAFAGGNSGVVLVSGESYHIVAGVNTPSDNARMVAFNPQNEELVVAELRYYRDAVYGQKCLPPPTPTATPSPTPTNTPTPTPTPTGTPEPTPTPDPYVVRLPLIMVQPEP